MTVVVTHTTPADSTFSSTGAAAWNANHALAGVGTMAEQDANAVAITGGTIDNTTIGATTPSTGVFTTLTATGQTSLGGAAGAEGLRVLNVPSSTRYIQVNGSVSSNVFIEAIAPSGNVGFVQTSRGTGTHAFATSSVTSNVQAVVSHTASAVNYHQLTGSATGSGPIHSVAGSDTNIDLNLTSKGTGSHVFNTALGVGFKVVDPGGGGAINNWWQASGYSGAPGLAVGGSGTNVSGGFTSKGTGSLEFKTNGFAQLQFNIAHTASAVNYVQVTGAATGGAVQISSQGSDSSVDLAYLTKADGYHRFWCGSVGNEQLRIIRTVSAVNYHQFTGSATGFGVVHSASGSDTNIPLVLQPKGTGALQAQQTDSTATGGNARGINAVDWQTNRGAAGQVASGQYAVVAGGSRNQSSGDYSFTGSGFNNSNQSYMGVIAGGQSNTNQGTYSFVGGGQSNSAQGIYTVIGGGWTNTGTAQSAVTTQAATANATTTITLGASNASIKVGQYIGGTYISGQTYVAAISGTTLTLSQTASGSGATTLSFYTPHGVVVGGGNNQATGSYSFIGGGGDAGTAANRNVASGDWSVVGGGVKNVASGLGSIVVGGGLDSAGNISGNTSSGASAVICGGRGHTASGNESTVLGGAASTANGLASMVQGRTATTRGITGNVVFAGSYSPISGGGSSQLAFLVLARQTTDATPIVLTNDGGAASTTNQIILPNNSAYAFRGTVIANVTGGGNTKAWAIEGAIKRGANAASTALVGTPTVTSAYADVGAATWAITATADTTNGGLAITFTGQAGTTIRVVCKVETTEVTF